MGEIILIYIYDEEIVSVQQATLYLGSYLKRIILMLSYLILSWMKANFHVKRI